jgi:hypothetical protein
MAPAMTTIRPIAVSIFPIISIITTPGGLDAFMSGSRVLQHLTEEYSMMAYFVNVRRFVLVRA